MKKSRLFALLLALAMVLSLFAGCAKDDPAPTPDTPAPTPGTTTPTPSEPTPAEPVAKEKVYRTYMSSDNAMLNAHDDTETYVETPLKWCSSALWRTVPNEVGNNFDYIPDLATDLPKLIKTEENVTYTKFVAEPQDNGTSIYKPVDDVATMTTWEFSIRDEAVWHTGEQLTAEDMIYSWQMLIDPVLSNKMSNFLYNNAITILNGEKYFRGECEWDEVGIKLLEDGKTIQITCVGTPDERTFCSHFISRVAYPVYKEYYEAGMNDDRSETTYGDVLEHWNGCGPYYFVEWQEDNKHVYKKNPDHWLADLFHYDTVEVYIIKENNAAVQMFEAGKLDELTPDANTIENYLEDPRLVSYPSIYVRYLEVNDGSKPTKNPVADTMAWRKAVYHSIDRETIAKEFFGHMEPAGWYVNGEAGLLSPDGLTFRESEWGQKIEQMVADWSAEGHTTGYNPELARKYLQEAYAEKGLAPDTKITATFLYDSETPAWQKTAEWLDTQYDEIFEGLVDLTLTVYPAEMSTSAAKDTFEWDINNNNWGRGMSRTYPYECFYYFTSGYASHPNCYLSERLDAQFDYCRSIQNEPYETILEETYKAEMIYLEEVVHCPVVQVVNYTLFSDRLDVPVQTYIPSFGWGTMYGDIVE